MARYIDADKLLEEMTVNVLPNNAQFVYLAMRGMVRNAPTADVVEVKHGEWIKHFSYGCWHYDCPFCDDGFATDAEFKINQLPHYCSNCGARMDGGSNDL